MSLSELLGLSRTLDDPEPPPDPELLVFWEIPGRREPEQGRLHRKCGRTRSSETSSGTTPCLPRPDAAEDNPTRCSRSRATSGWSSISAPSPRGTSTC